MLMEKEKLTALVTAAQSGDNEAFGELFEAFQSTFYYHALKNVDNDTDIAKEVTQEAFIEIFNTIGKLEAPAAFVSWAKTIVYHQCTRYFKKKVDITVDEDENGATLFDSVEEQKTEFIPDAAVDKDDFKATILSFISSLPDEQRAAVMMYYFDEMPVKEIAEMQGLSVGTVKSRLNYARKGIKEQVEEYEKKNGIKLHSVAMLPLIKWLFAGSFEGGISAASAAAMAESISAATGVTVSAAAATTATAAGITATSAAAGITAKILGLPLATKLIAGVLALTIAVGGTALALGGDKNKDNPSSAPTASEPNDEMLGQGGPSFDDHTHAWGETYVYETKKLGVVDIEYKEKACKVCGLTESVKGDMWMLAANVLGDEQYTFLDRYFELGGIADGEFNIAGLFAAGDFLATEPYYDRESVEISATDYYNNLLQYFELTADTISKMKQERPGDTYTLSFEYNGSHLLATSCIWLRDNIYRVYYTAGGSHADYMPIYYVDIEYNLHNGQPNKIVGINTDGKAFYDTSRVDNTTISADTLIENISAYENLASYDFDINSLSLADADYTAKFLRATDIFGYNLTTEEAFGKLWGEVKPEFEGGSLKKITTSFYLPIDYWSNWETDVNAVRAGMTRTDMDKFIKLVGKDNYKLLYNDGEETKEISLSELTDDMIRSVVSGWEGIGSIRLESISSIDAGGKSCDFAFTVVPANGLIQNAYFADFEIAFS